MNGAADPQPTEPAEDPIKAVTRFLDEQHDREGRYTQTVTVVGYAGFLGLWQIAKDYVTAAEARLALVLMLVSLTLFVLWEVVSMVHRVIRSLRVSRTWTNRTDDEQGAAAALDRVIQMHDAQIATTPLLVWAWAIQVVLEVLFGLTGIAVLLLALLQGERVTEPFPNVQPGGEPRSFTSPDR
jgi:predicted histidine transporter YuiF (NhaC family)